MKISVGIKALNEERHIEAAIVSALAAIEGLDGEVILADSGSTDRTIEIARAFPIRIVQFADSAGRCCGAGAQLAYQHAQGEYFYILDGDMVLDPGFLRAGIAYLEAHPGAAAVGGIVREMNTEAAEFEIRARAVARDGGWKPGPVVGWRPWRGDLLSAADPRYRPKSIDITPRELVFSWRGAVATTRRGAYNPGRSSSPADFPITRSAAS